MTASAKWDPADTNHRRDVYRRDLVGGVALRVSVGSIGGSLRSPSVDGAMSGNGRYVVFRTGARVLTQDRNRRTDIYRRGPL
jgi:hypothetical protein